MPAPFHLFYVHGFNSSPQSAKARLIGQAVAELPHVQYQVPTLPYEPQRAIAILDAAVRACLPGRVGLIGSSMGGFYGTYIAERYDLPLVLVNPAVRPFELLQDYLGENENIYTGEKYSFTEEHIAQLRTLDVEPVTQPSRYLLLTQTGDEVLDYQQGVTKYIGCRQIVEPGGSHGFDGFEHHLQTIFSFFDL
ncbi:MAG TPA: YqiA/YcfP family alpha/beta fold hydrolase [Dongiaceae bacterium]|nr:YqiA/YcfP family alpha/beta fold hydrolase [Dongiaceae bacterium]